MAAVSVTRLADDVDLRWLEARCRNTQPVRRGLDACAQRGHGMGKLLARYTTGCLVPGGQIELKCPICNSVLIIGSS